MVDRAQAGKPATGQRRQAARAFSPAILRLDGQAPSPLPRALLWTIAALVSCALIGACVGRLDVIAIAHGRVVPQSFLKIVQPAESGVVRELLVREGDPVDAGQVLVRMDARLSDADTATLHDQLATRRLQLRRIDAELAGAAMPARTDDPPVLLAQADAQYRAHRAAHLDAVAAETAALDKARSELQSARAIESKLAKALPIYREQADGWELLAKEGFAGRLLALERKRQWLEADQELNAQAAHVESLRAVIAQATSRIAQLRSTYRRELQDERVEAQAELARLTQDSARQSVRRGQLELRAPVAGIIKDLGTHTVGTVVQPGTVLMTVVPRGEGVQAEVWVEQVDAGFVRERLPVQLKVAAYPFQRYGMVSGHVRHLSPDASEGQSGSDAAGHREPGSGSSGYRALVALDATHLMRDGERFELASGMQVSAEIRLGTRSVMEYLLLPVQKTLQEAGREH